ncbi:hypothetical protein ACIBQ1_61765 [Nonomuraea sp. NPDC050153]|uniref:hypothetical protein n=1 Tax=Nonomuraea sp. NPDC050153 TaxID=3364359 RepID=UPI00378910DF
MIAAVRSAMTTFLDRGSPGFARRVAPAIQYGHLRSTLVSEGHASCSRGGVHELIGIKTVRVVADTVAGLREGIVAGEGISGSA